MNFLKMLTNSRSAFAALAAVALFAAVAGTSASARNVQIIVNGQYVNFDQPPIERSGRVFVPLRGVFERLGASVVYDNGAINASGRGHNISLRIGSQTAVVDGQQRTLDVAPFLVGARTLVPLRFVSESLGAAVDWNDQSQTVTINGGGGSTGGNNGGNNNPPPATVGLKNVSPADGSAVDAKRPTVSGQFTANVNPNSVHLTLDDRDVSTAAYVSDHDFLFTPSYDLPSVQHTVRVTGTSSGGTPFDAHWSFTSGTSTVANYITNVTPAEGATVGSTFRLTGKALPGSAIHIAAQGSTIYGIFRVTTGTYVADLTADASGNFGQEINLGTAQGGTVTVRITATAPVTKASSTKTLQYHT